MLKHIIIALTVLAIADARFRRRNNQNARKNYRIDSLQAKTKKGQDINTNFTKNYEKDHPAIKSDQVTEEDDVDISIESEMGYEYFLKERKEKSNRAPSFRDYMHKYDISHVMKKLHKETSNTTEQFLLAADLIDPTDELLNIKIEPVNPNPFILETNRRAWIPPSKLKPKMDIDPYSLRPRLYFLMQQSLYQARDRLVEMQELRTKYRDRQVYKMGYLMARTDHLAQLFAGDAFKARHVCSMQEEYHDSTPGWRYRYNRKGVRVITYDYFDFIERLLNHWFEIDLLRELIQRNHERALIALKIDMKNWTNYWEFET